MSDPDLLSVTPADVLYSADYLEGIGLRAAAERRALGVELSGNTTGWQDGGRAGFTGFLDVVSRQAERIQTEVTDVAAKLRAAAHAYVENDHRSADNLRWDRTDS